METKKAVLALDQGTTSSRAILFDVDSKILGLGQQEFTQHFPEPGWVEHDPLEIWQSQCASVRVALKEAKLSSEEVAALGITNQRETIVLWDRATGEPLAPAIVWQDRRTAGICQELKGRGLEEEFQSKTGLLLDPYFSGSKIAWLLKEHGLQERAKAGELAVGTIDSWLLWKLTSGALHATDVSNASRTLLFNIHSLQWDEELLQHLEVPLEILPELRSSQGDFAVVDCGEGFDGIPVRAMIGDQQSALFGQAAFEKGMGKNTYGTGCFFMLNTGQEVKRSEHRLLSTIAWQLEGEKGATYALEGSVFIGGAVVQWLRDGLKIVESGSDAQQLAAQVEDNGGVYMVPAFTGLGAPYWEPEARGAIYGITRGTSRAHLARAAIESIALQSKDLIDCAAQDLGSDFTQLRVDGGAVVNEDLMQLQADLLQCEVLVPEVSETTALGAAYLAGLSVGFWQSQQELSKMWGIAESYKPRGAESELAQLTKLEEGWQRAVQSILHWSQGSESSQDLVDDDQEAGGVS